MSLSAGDALRLAALGWQSECALRNRADLAGAFAAAALSEAGARALPTTADECVELGRSMLRVRLASEAEPVRPGGPGNVVSGEIGHTPDVPDHVHTIDPDRSVDNCAGCDSLKRKWRDEEVAKERARRDRWAEKLVTKTQHLQNINDMSGKPADYGLLAAMLITDVIDDVESRLDKIEDRLINIASAIHGDERD